MIKKKGMIKGYEKKLDRARCSTHGTLRLKTHLKKEEGTGLFNCTPENKCKLRICKFGFKYSNSI